MLPIASTRAMMMKAGSSVQNTPVGRLRPGQLPMSGMPIQGASRTLWKSYKPNAAAIPQPTTTPMSGAHILMRRGARNSINTIPPSVAIAVSGAPGDQNAPWGVREHIEDNRHNRGGYKQ